MESTNKFTLNLDCNNLLRFNPQLYYHLVNYPLEIIPIMDCEATHFFTNNINNNNNSEVVIRVYFYLLLKGYVLLFVIIRPFNLKNIIKLRDLGQKYIEKLICIKGILIYKSSINANMNEGCIFY